MLKVLLVVAVIAFVVWLLVRVALRRIGGDGGDDGSSRPRVIAPDDDPDFLRGLDRRRRDPEDD